MAAAADWYETMKQDLTEKARHQTVFAPALLQAKENAGMWVVLTWEYTPSKWIYWCSFTTRHAAVRYCDGKFSQAPGASPVRVVRVKLDGKAGKVIDPFAGSGKGRDRYGAPVTS